ncbi:DUF59 family protein [Natrialba magadii ATCC 43099]|uniref:DUF59 family protein n=1 Tax=Natrialba magadii (strain ATCC 43099 / DSM 3394 / CCM 3739 / CIP 104546 / IAM 13178 / JCM 8861 / NBRC 102185 / NCIMB 2190 / MS3) TaxID=547559 RepID=D3SQX0_NATMM|nr:1,2-phenylacetyl-CoA epoxidase subunit PaaD [Natrialba magadii]ADD04608.1 DUF59 family protein [Natrialba magadii ATCC 43099]ELY25264.1 hypothetical protein C500_17641 [Natrialba magadii ATCC 43099]
MSSNRPESTETDATPCAYTEYRSADGDVAAELPATGADATGLESDIWEALYEIEDPEMPISIVDLGLIYGVNVAEGVATVDMTLTYSGCPAREMLTEEVEETAAAVEGVDDAELRLVWNPPWTVDLVTEQGKEDLREFGLSI